MDGLVLLLSMGLFLIMNIPDNKKNSGHHACEGINSISKYKPDNAIIDPYIRNNE